MEYYFKNVRPKEHIESLGKKLYIKITEVIQSEVEEITEQDCIDYISQLVPARIDVYPAPRASVQSSRPWVALGMDLPESLPVDVGIDLGGGDVRMAEHHLDRTQVCPPLEEVGGKGVP